LHRFEEAKTAFTVSIALAPRAWAYRYRGLTNLQLDQPEAARNDFNRALDLDPHLAVAALDRGLLACRERRYEEAMADFERAAADHADAAEIAYGKALVYSAQGQKDLALEQLRQLLSLQPAHEAGQTLARSLSDGD
jgi:tetratricopeptide (TPR) repeat protein